MGEAAQGQGEKTGNEDKDHLSSRGEKKWKGRSKAFHREGTCHLRQIARRPPLREQGLHEAGGQSEVGKARPIRNHIPITCDLLHLVTTISSRRMNDSFCQDSCVLIYFLTSVLSPECSMP